MIVFLLIFILVTIIYSHILFHWKVSNDIDVPHVASPQKDNLERIADFRQPFIFEQSVEDGIALKQYNDEVFIKKHNEIALKVPHKAMLSAVKKEPYLSKDNNTFMSLSTFMSGSLEKTREYLRPPMTMREKHDVIYGNLGVYTDITASENYRNYFFLIEGEIEVKLCPPKSKNILSKRQNISNDLWSENGILQNECDIIVIPITKGSIIHIPAHWWYSIRFKTFACVVSYSYITYMNAISQIPTKLKLKT